MTETATRPSNPVQDDDLLRTFLHPRSIAIIGASTNPSKLIAVRPVEYLRRYGFTGDVYPVNPRYEQVQGFPCYPSVADVPGEVDLALIALPRDHVLEALQDCADAGVRAAVVFSSGFAEVDDGHGPALQEQISGFATRTGMAVVGPNCQGMANLATGCLPCFSTAFAGEAPQVDRLAVISQSGAVAAMTYNMLVAGGSGARYWVSTGNEADISVSRVVRAVVEDSHVDTLCVYLESVRDYDLLAAAAARAAELGKTIVVTRSAMTAHGWTAATRHTGAGAGDPLGARATLPTSPALLQADSLEQMVALALLARARKRVRSGRTAVISNSGGLGVLTADAVESAGLPLSELAENTQEHLREFLPAFAATNNPVDVTAQLLNDGNLLSRTLPALANDPEVDVVVIALGAVGDGYDVDKIVDDLASANRATDQLYVVVWVGSRVNVQQRLRDSGVPVFADFHNATSALHRWIRHHSTPVAAPGPASPCLDDLRPGHTYRSGTELITPGDLDGYANLIGQAGESGNIHVDPDAAHRAGFRDRVAAGLHVLAYLNVLGQRIGLWTHATILRSLKDVRFTAAVLAGDRVRCDMTVEQVVPSRSDDTRGTVRFAFTLLAAATDEPERACVTGTVDYIFHRRRREAQ